jgi:hypothetical protein
MAEPKQNEVSRPHKVGARELRGNLIGFLRQARHGATFLITSRDQVLRDVRNIYRVRAALLELIAADVACHAPDNGIEQLRRFVSQMRAAYKAGDFDSYVWANVAFHGGLPPGPADKWVTSKGSGKSP